MEARSKEAILSKTHYGIRIYAHILRLYYPSETVLSLSGRTCSPTKNPFNADKSTLNIFIEKESVLGNALDKEFAWHSDSENAIPAGDGLKWIIEIDTRKAPHGEYFASVANYILQTYSVEVDKSGKDISRACFLPFDPNAFINPLLLNKHEQENI